MRLVAFAMGGRGGKTDYRRGRGRGKKGRRELQKAGELAKPLLEEFGKIGKGRRNEDVRVEVEDTLYRIKRLEGAASNIFR
jgi:hypothetical protein